MGQVVKAHEQDSELLREILFLISNMAQSPALQSELVCRVCLSVSLPLCLSVCLSVCLAALLSVCVYVCVCVCVPVSLCPEGHTHAHMCLSLSL